MKYSNERLDDLAEDVRQHLLPYIETKGTVSDDDVREIIRKHCGCSVRSSRSIEIIQRLLPEL